MNPRAPRRATLLGWGLATPALVLLAAFLVLPLGRLLQEGGVAWHAWSEPYYQERLAWTLRQAVGTSALAALLGVPLAYLLSRFDVPFKASILRALLLPFVTPTLVAAMGLLALFGPRGYSGLDLTESAAIVILGNLFFNLPLMVRLSYAGFARVPPNLIAAARTLGQSPLRAALSVALPLALPGLLAGATLVFLYSALSFGLPFLLGGSKYATLEVEIYTLTAYELRLADAGALVGVQLLVTILATSAYLWLAARSVALQPGRQTLPRARGSVALLLAALLLVTLAVCFGPLLAVAVRSFVGMDGFTSVFWRGLFREHEPSLSLMLRNTLTFAFVALAGALFFGGLHALGTWRARSRLLDLLSLLPLMVSPISLAVGYLLLYPRLRAELPLLLAAYVLLAAPLVTRSLLPALRALPVQLLEAARSLGSSSPRAWRTVALPLVAPALRGGAALALATVLGEFAATLVLSRPEWATLSIGIAERLARPGALNLGEACALATLLMGLSLASFTLLGGKGEVA
ncbi:ABC transporter permease [Deinococcus peraridilitoris]|uniref:ABC-type Fe3+ transport system, permease component n=1 Tax=Deinococcus peraridilitoris (strain DSM 19664 / LMG 22246 / CIP 109416 / KR-200) TaxID=937777 RepID=L0A3A2_DEIPD|nr:iron ABC transporter permease [Deinococcus peraridilitoris]AFZ68326.1 ABC-type Fe3+ transport system, permease component [Deinococcus peraridilitoris DSM 19664]